MSHSNLQKKDTSDFDWGSHDSFSDLNKSVKSKLNPPQRSSSSSDPVSNSPPNSLDQLDLKAKEYLDQDGSSFSYSKFRNTTSSMELDGEKPNQDEDRKDDVRSLSNSKGGFEDDGSERNQGQELNEPSPYGKLSWNSNIDRSHEKSVASFLDKPRETEDIAFNDEEFKAYLKSVGLYETFESILLRLFQAPLRPEPESVIDFILDRLDGERQWELKSRFLRTKDKLMDEIQRNQELQKRNIELKAQIDEAISKLYPGVDLLEGDLDWNEALAEEEGLEDDINKSGESLFQNEDPEAVNLKDEDGAKVEENSSDENEDGEEEDEDTFPPIPY